ncbi:hypothetical protein [Yersinia mollaretii]|uniref:hypothetical protein n=1 Tax=Yersinia mollaretii TaxID=33060 RepID=UPI00119F8335|nr:hypothetical protein [Yersinia mollaretii]
MSMISTPSPVRYAAAPKVSSPSSFRNSSLAGNLSGVSSSSENSPLSHTKSASEENCHCFSQNSAGGTPLPVVDGEKHIQALHLHLSQGESSVENMADFSRIMNQGDESCIRASNILHGTKAALALFSMLPAEKRDSVTVEARSFYNAMAKLSENSGSANKQKNAEQKLEKFNKALLKASGLDNKSADKQNNLDDFCTHYLNEFVYSDVIEKLSGVITPEQLEVIKGNPEKITEVFYRDLNGTNNLMATTLGDGFLSHHGVNDKAAQMHELITKLEHKTEIIAGIISNSLASDSPATSANADVPDSPRRAPAPDYNMASPATPNMAPPTAPANGASVISSVISPVFNNNFGELAPALNKIADVLERVISLENRLLPGDTSIGASRLVERTEVGTQTPEAPLENDPPTYAEAVESMQPEQIQLKTTVPLMATPIAQNEPTIEDETNFVSTRSVVLSQPEAPATDLPKKPTSSLNAQGTFFGSQGAVLPKYSDAAPVALTNGAISGSSQSVSYRNSDTNRVAAQSKIAPFTDTEMEGSSQPDNIQAKPMAPLMAKPMDQKVLTSEDDIDGASTPSPVVSPPEAPVMAAPKKPTYSLNSDGTAFGTKGGGIQSYREVPRVALTNGAISGSSQSASYANSDTKGQLAEALKSREEQSAKTTKSVNSAGSQFMGLNSTQNRTQINFTPKNKTVEYRLNESLNGKAN